MKAKQARLESERRKARRAGDTRRAKMLGVRIAAVRAEIAELLATDADARVEDARQKAEAEELRRQRRAGEAKDRDRAEEAGERAAVAEAEKVEREEEAPLPGDRRERHRRRPSRPLQRKQRDPAGPRTAPRRCCRAGRAGEGVTAGAGISFSERWGGH